MQNRSNADISDVLFEDIRVEYTKYQTPEQGQSLKGQKYGRKNEMHVPSLIRFENAHYTDWDFSRLYPYGISHDIVFRNIQVYLDEGVSMPACEFWGIDEAHKIFNITIENLTVNGLRLREKSQAKFDENEFTDNICLF